MKKETVSIYKLTKVDNLSTLSKKFNMLPTEFLIKTQISPKQIFEGNIIYINRN